MESSRVTHVHCVRAICDLVVIVDIILQQKIPSQRALKNLPNWSQTGAHLVVVVVVKVVVVVDIGNDICHCCYCHDNKG